MSSKSLKFITKLQGSRVLVIGGTSGLGFSVAEMALEYGARVIVSGSSQARLDKGISRLHATLFNGSPLISDPNAPNLVTGKTCDLNDATNLEANIEALMKYATNDGADKLDHVVFTAGNPIELKPVAEGTADYMHASGLVRFTGSGLVGKFLPQYMHNKSSSSYTLTSGTNSLKPNPGWWVFAGIAASIEGLARGLAVDIRPIRVNVVQPGAIKTEFWDGVPQQQIEEVLEKYRKQSLLDAVGTPEECAEAYMYCMRDSFTTGTTVACDGGRLIMTE